MVTCRTIIHHQYSCLENLMDRGAWQAIGHRDAQSWTQLKRFSTCSGQKYEWRYFPGGTVNVNLPTDAGDTGLILVWEDSTCLGATKPVLHRYCSPKAFAILPLG